MPIKVTPARSSSGNSRIGQRGWLCTPGSLAQLRKRMPYARCSIYATMPPPRATKSPRKSPRSHRHDDNRLKLNKLLRDPKIGVIVVEHEKIAWPALRVGSSRCSSRRRDAGLRRSFHPTRAMIWLTTLWPSAITSMAARIYGRRNSKRPAACVKQAIEQCMDVPDEDTRRGFRTELDLNNKQRTACLRHTDHGALCVQLRAAAQGRGVPGGRESPVGDRLAP